MVSFVSAVRIRNGIGFLLLLKVLLLVAVSETVTAGTTTATGSSSSSSSNPLQEQEQQQQEHRELEQEEEQTEEDAVEVLPPLDMVGGFKGTIRENCRGLYMGVLLWMGLVPDLGSAFRNQGWQRRADRDCQALENTEGYNWHFQDCLEITIHDGTTVHHMVMGDDDYVLEDYMYGKPIRAKATIEWPTPEEAADGATSVWSASLYDTATRSVLDSVVIRRYINSDGDLVLTQDFTAGVVDDENGDSYDTKGKFVFRKFEDLSGGCRPYDPTGEYCSSKVYTDTPDSWTTGCCENYGGDGVFDRTLRYPWPDYYDSQRSIRNRDCFNAADGASQKRCVFGN